MFPPQHDDFKLWIKFRRFVNKWTHLETIVKSWTYKFMSNFIILLTFINCIAYLGAKKHELYILDDVFEVIFVVDIALRIIGLGYENFFKDKWNNVDFVLVIIILLV